MFCCIVADIIFRMPKAGVEAIKRHFEKLGVHGESGKGNYNWKCRYCKLVCPGITKHCAEHFKSTTKGPRCNMNRVGGKEKGTATYFDILSQSIYEVGGKSVVGVIMDNVVGCARADRVVEDTFPLTFHVSYVVHCLDLMMHDIGKIEWVAGTVTKANDMAKFVMNHQRVKDVYYIHAGGRQLLRPTATRFAINFHMQDHLKKQRKALVAMVTDDMWTAALVPHAERSTLHEMEDIILDAAGFGDLVNKAILADGNGPTISKVYAKMDRIVEHLRLGVNKDLTVDQRDEIEVMVMRRWNAMTSPLHRAALFLDPEYRLSQPHKDAEIQDGFYTWQMSERAKDLIEWDDPPTEEEQKEAKERVKVVERRLKSLTSVGDSVVPLADGGDDEDGDEVVVPCREECNLEEIEEGQHGD
ncbi:hypothetical protein CBR_g26178 [Chara braunii]|uniref:DUF659 domain-containing protein n=1 Tax=Chara braunii TaxID=69332 RepID=A0A388L7C6_CHABU|nr:hypothetical protein CBR_g26178 [Chara braunii]|eukprot:GBG78142.1 hypothetical protein CBR_g26178 [Chara braunii]